MYSVSEIEIDKEIVYTKKYQAIDINNNYEEKVSITHVIIKRDGRDYILLYDNKNIVIRDAYRYLNNDKMMKKSINTRLTFSSSLKRLYAFLIIFQIDITNLDEMNIDLLKDFLYGGKKSGILYTFDLLTTRNSDTVNQLLSAYRNYLKFLKIENEIMNERQSPKESGHGRKAPSSISEKIVSKYTVSEQSQQNKSTVPMYISEEDFKKIISLIKIEYSLREEIIVRLMYENGLRLGEVLGINLEDVEEDRIVIRNRVSDNKDQHAKTCYRPQTIEDYANSTYTTWRKGFQFVKPKLSLMDKINEYIDLTHGNMSIKNRNNYITKAKADKVSKANCLEGDNYYLFLNKNGTPLRKGGWNKILRHIYETIGIKVDSGARKHNLSHRLRHGFAMKRVKEGIQPIQLAEDLRHSGVSCVMCYFRPTEQDVYDANTTASEYMINENPELES